MDEIPNGLASNAEKDFGKVQGSTGEFVIPFQDMARNVSGAGAKFYYVRCCFAL